MKKLTLLLLLIFATAANAAPVTWTTSTVSGPSDVNTAGTLFGAMEMGSATPQTINGVTFAANPGGAGPHTLGSGTVTLGSLGITAAVFWPTANPGGDAAYGAALNSGRYSAAASGAITLGGLTIGRRYLVQLWITDTRSAYDARVRFVDGVATTSGGPDNIATGTFVADATTQVITITPATSFGPQVNLLQVREPYWVVNNADSGAGSLRQAVADAVAAPGAHTITFDPALSGQTITLGSEIALDDDLTLDATNLPGGLTIHGGTGNNRIFSVSSGKTVALSGLTLTSGNITAAAGPGLGGAIYNRGTLTLTQCTLSGNTANAAEADGGAIFNDGTLTLTQCTLSGNSANDEGGAIFNFGTLTLSQCTLSGNSASSRGGGAILNFGTLTLTNSLIAGNTAPTGPDIRRSSGTITRSGVNLIGNNETVETQFPSASPNGNGDHVGSSAAPLASQVAALASNGGPTQTMRLLPDSLARDRIATALFTTDQRGFPILGNADVGAYEAQLGSLAAASTNEDTATTALPFSVGTVGTLTATSSNTALVPNASLVLGGSGSSRTLTATPVANANGTVTITITDSASQETTSFPLTVTPVNDAPTFTKGANQSVAMSSGPMTVAGWATAISPGPANESGQTLGFLASNNNNALFSVQPAIAANGTLTFTPAPWQTGSATVTVQLQDNGSGVAPNVNLSAAQTFSITVTTVTTLTVTNTNDTGTGSLRVQINDALNATGSRLIVFAPALSGQTITLSSEIALSESSFSDTLWIDAASLPGGLTIDGGPGTNRIFYLPSGDRANLRGLTLTGGNGTGAILSGNGGAIYTDGTLTLTQCTLSGNSATRDGGAIYNNSTLTLTQCTLSGNSASNRGGAIYNDGTLTLTLTQCTLSENSASTRGGAILNQGTLTLTNSLIAGNTAPTGPDISLTSGNLTRNGVNLIGKNDTVISQFPAGSPNLKGDYVGNSTTPLDPLLAPLLANNGGPTQTRRLLPGSPALNRSLSVSEAQFVEVRGGSPDQFSLTFGAASTPLMPNNSSAATVQTALNALSTIGGAGGSVSVSGISVYGVFVVIFHGGPLAGVNQPALTGTATGSTTVTVSTLVDGGNPFTTDQRGFPIVGLADIGAYESGARTLAPIADRAILVNTNTGAIPFPIGTAGNAAAPLTLTATSGNLTLVPNANAVLGGSGVNRTVTVTPAANQTGTATLTLTVTDGYDPSSTSFNVTVLPNTGFNTWKLAQFGNNAANPALAGDTADFDNDGQSTFLEYATRGNPLAFSSNPLGPPTLVAGPAYQFSFPYRPGVTDLRYIVQRSGTLGGWT